MDIAYPAFGFLIPEAGAECKDSAKKIL